MRRLQLTVRYDPTGSAKLSRATLDYVRACHRQQAYDLVMQELQRTGTTQAELASRLGKPRDIIAGLLSGPQDWDLDIISDLLFAISGAVPGYVATYPFSASQDAEQPTSPDHPLPTRSGEADLIIETPSPAHNPQSMKAGFLHLIAAALGLGRRAS